jgi:GMP synthase-like glutamine amidotransferase
MNASNPPPMRWHCPQHVPFEGPAYLATWIRQSGHVLTSTELWKEAVFPQSDEYDGLFILGGPMNAYEVEKYAWLAAEQHFVARAIFDRKPILGVCLGAQLLAVVLGGTVTEDVEKEIGWFPVALTPTGRDSILFRDFPDQFMALHWHGDYFSIPPGAVRIARSEACDEQAFVYENHVVGLQFHLESDKHSIAAMIQHCGDDICCGHYIQDSHAIEDCANHLPASHRLLSKLLDNLCNCARTPRSARLILDHEQRQAT